jgi:hypothetical protein
MFSTIIKRIYWKMVRTIIQAKIKKLNDKKPDISLPLKT